jgi:hypothetical protein
VAEKLKNEFFYVFSGAVFLSGLVIAIYSWIWYGYLDDWSQIIFCGSFMVSIVILFILLVVRLTHNMDVKK